MSSQRIRSVAVLGSGIMGAPMARRLAGAGLEVRVWNRTRERAESLADDVSAIADTPGEAVDGADAFLTILSDGDAVATVADGDDGALAEAGPDAIWVQSSTVGIEATARLAALASDAGVGFVDAPVLGTKQPAEEGKLVVLASGPESLRPRLEPLFEAIAQRTVWLGDAGAGSRMKLVVNAWLLAMTAGLGAAVGLAERLGVDPDEFLDLIKGGPMGPPYAELKGRAMAKHEFGEAAFPLKHAEKDANLVLAAANDGQMRFLEAVSEAFQRASQAGHGDEDMAAVYWASAPDA